MATKNTTPWEYKLKLTAWAPKGHVSLCKGATQAFSPKKKEGRVIR
jgi:hypothetical protein